MAATRIATTTVAGLEVDVLRYELADFEIDSFPVSDGHFIVYRVRGGDRDQ